MKAFLRRISIILLALVAVILIGTVLFSRFEGLSLFEALYFTIVTVATVGYGDITPTTVASKVLAIVVVLVGVGAFTGIVVNSTQFFVDRSGSRQRHNRVNTLIELFFSEVGSQLLRILSNADPGLDALRPDLAVDLARPDGGLARLRRTLVGHSFALSPERLELESLNVLLGGQAELVTRLLENPNLSENEEVTEMLRATFHLRQELKARTSLTALPRTDLEHLTNDAKRIYRPAAEQWLAHITYLRKNYPYLFSISVRTNPFAQSSSAEVK
jgi:voltage-gated potassium channel